MARLLTARFIETIKPQPKLKEYPDPSGVRLAVHPTGHKSYVHRYRVAGKPRKDTLGPAIGEGALTLAIAREAVAKARRQLEQGVVIPRPVPASSGDSVAYHATQFLTNYHVVRSRPATVRSAELTFANIVLPAWQGHAVNSIRRRDVIELIEATASERGPGAAVGLVRVLSKFFGWLLTREVIETSPCVGVRAVLTDRPKPRQRTLSDDELVALLKAADSNRPTDRAIWVLALTGCRRNEVGEMRWSELDSKTRTWTVPAERSKNHRPLAVQLSTQAWKIIDAQPRIGDFVFTSYGRGPVRDWDKSKKRLSAKAGIDEVSWRVHDIRRTVASGLQRLGIRTEVIERALGHHSGTFKGIVGTYQTDPLAHEVRAALQLWADHVEELVLGPRSAKVVRMRKAK